MTADPLKEWYDGVRKDAKACREQARQAIEAETAPLGRMTVGEASRQYQVALEAWRQIRSECSTLISTDDLLNDAATQVDLALGQLTEAWIAASFRAVPVLA